MPKSLWNAPIDDITFEDVRGFCAQQHREGERLDYKREPSGNDAPRQIAKLVCALANQSGGLILYGIDEDPPGSRLPERAPEGKALSSGTRSQIMNSCGRIVPPVAVLASELLPNPEPTKQALSFLVVRVEPSLDMPHSFEGDWWIREADKCEPRKPDRGELQAMFDRRRNRVSIQDERVERGRQRLLNAILLGGDSGNAIQTEGITIGIGPLVCDKPVIDLAKWKRPEVQTHPNWGGFRPERVADGFYQVTGEGARGWLQDAFGNVIVAECADIITHLKELRFLGSSDWVAARQGEKGYPVIFLNRLLSTVFEATERACSIFETCSLTGGVRVRVKVTGLLEALLVAGDRNALLAANRTDSTIDFTLDLGSESLRADGWDCVVAITRRLLWDWGSRMEDMSGVERLVEVAELVAYGGGIPCPAVDGRFGHRKPARDRTCRTCSRDQNKSQAPP